MPAGGPATGDCEDGRSMRPHEIAARLQDFRHRGPGTDAERRAANWLAQELAGAGGEVRIEPF
jgi:hypothetical protein